ncbi:hypothetical protein TrLO_g13268 [Triparma laevis f. longispina]|uniref:Prolyl 4-hydroxylase alpha subunit domain-containing protein n=2 Tax=Triparma laevis TaxID=1534972 RepID=A0A9W7ANQ2_9STRA|nr:hypothetical protein TrLO_g13268 [Triparma laevis f. longispina]
MAFLFFFVSCLCLLLLIVRSSTETRTCPVTTRTGFVTLFNPPSQPLTTVSSQPWIFTIDNFLTPSECKTLISLASSSGLTQANVGDKKRREEKGTYDSDHRRCSSLNLPSSRTPIKRVREKCASLFENISVEHLEVTQISRYIKGDFFRVHDDGIHPYYSSHTKKMCSSPPHCNRVATIFVYLNDVEEGGETRFTQTDPEIFIKPKKGMAVLFFPAKMPDDEKDPGGLAEGLMHESVTAVDEKWILQQFVWSGKYIGVGA